MAGSPGMPVVEMTSGNMGADWPWPARRWGILAGHDVRRQQPGARRMLEGLGAEVILVPQVDGAPGQVTGADAAAADMAAASAADSMWTSSTRSSASRRTRPARAARSWNSWADPPTAGSRRARAAPSWAWRGHEGRQRGNRVRRRRAAGLRSAGRPAGLEGAAPDPGHQLRRGAAALGRVADGPEPGRDGRGSRGVAPDAGVREGCTWAIPPPPMCAP